MLMPNCEWRQRWRAYSSEKSTLTRLMGRDVRVLMDGFPPGRHGSRYPQQASQGRSEELVKWPAQDFANRRAHLMNLRRRYGQRRRQLQDVGLVLAKAHQHRVARM